MPFQERRIPVVEGGRVLTPRPGEVYVVFPTTPVVSGGQNSTDHFGNVLDSVATANNGKNAHGVGQVRVTLVEGNNGQVWSDYLLVGEGVGRTHEVRLLQGDQAAVNAVIRGAEQEVLRRRLPGYPGRPLRAA